MAKTYYLKFGTGIASAFSGLSPTLSIFSANGVTNRTPPGITETPAGSGLYRFQYSPSLSIVFQADGGAALASGDRYIYGAIDTIQSVDEKVGVVTDTFGTSAVDPTTLMGKLNRVQENQEGQATFTKATGIWDVYSRGGSLLFERTLTNTTTVADKS